MIRIAVVQFPGSNCERETALAVKRAGMEPEDIFWNTPTDKVAACDGFILTGGFSYEDRSRAGIIAAMDPFMQTIRQAADAGKPVLGICNGAQILVESGLVPGLADVQTAMALTDNQRIHDGRVEGTGYYNAWVHMRLSDREPLTAFTKNMSAKAVMSLPVAHAEGRFVIPEGLLREMHAQGMCVFQYCDADGHLTPTFPVNPNGSVDNIAAVSNRAGNVMAMMPHPERTPAGDPIFQSMRDYIASGHVQKVRPLRYLARPVQPAPYHRPAGTHEFITGLKITDNHAISVENVFHHHGIPLRIRRYEHWEIACPGSGTVEKMQAAGFWFNPHRALRAMPQQFAAAGGRLNLLVQPIDDVVGQKRLQQFRTYLGGEAPEAIRSGVLWQIETAAEHAEVVLNSPVFCNPFSHHAWVY